MYRALLVLNSCILYYFLYTIFQQEKIQEVVQTTKIMRNDSIKAHSLKKIFKLYKI